MRGWSLVRAGHAWQAGSWTRESCTMCVPIVIESLNTSIVVNDQPIVISIVCANDYLILRYTCTIQYKVQILMTWVHLFTWSARPLLLMSFLQIFTTARGRVEGLHAQCSHEILEAMDKLWSFSPENAVFGHSIFFDVASAHNDDQGSILVCK